MAIHTKELELFERFCEEVRGIIPEPLMAKYYMIGKKERRHFCIADWGALQISLWAYEWDKIRKELNSNATD